MLNWTVMMRGSTALGMRILRMHDGSMGMLWGWAGIIKDYKGCEKLKAGSACAAE